MNSVNLIGRLTKDPELQERGGTTVCEMRLAVDNRGHEPTYVDVVTFDAQAIACAEYLSKGRQVGVEGRLHYTEWEAKDGGRRSRHSVVGRVEFLGSPPPDQWSGAEVERTSQRAAA